MIISSRAFTALRDTAARMAPTSGVLRSIAKWADWTPPELPAAA